MLSAAVCPTCLPTATLLGRDLSEFLLPFFSPRPRRFPMARLWCLGHHPGRNCIWLPPALQGKSPLRGHSAMPCHPWAFSPPPSWPLAYLQRHYSQWAPGPEHSGCGGSREHSRRDMNAHGTAASPLHPDPHTQHDPTTARQLKY